MALAAGMLLNLPGAWYLAAALTEIARARPSTAQALAAIVVFNLIMSALAELAIIAYVGEPPRATERVNTLSSLAHQHSRPIWVRIVKLVLGVLSSCSPRRSGGGVYGAAASLSCPDG